VSGDRTAIAVTSTPAAEHVSYVAGAICEVLAAAAEHRTSESVQHAALDVLRQATQSAPVTIAGAHVEMGDSATARFDSTSKS
jgi:hypothetical protein